MSVTLSVQYNSRGLSAIIENFLNFPSRRREALARIIKEGVLHNYDALAMGGSIPTADGSNIQWSRHRHRMTIAIRQSQGLGALFPILTLTGKLRTGLAGGSTVDAIGNSLMYTVSGSIRELVKAHQYGLKPLASQSSVAMGLQSMPPREMVFWSSEMARQIRVLAQASVKK